MPEQNENQTWVEDSTGVFNKIAATLEAIKKIADLLNGKRSCVIEVDNNTKHSLVKAWDNHSHGGFAQTPKDPLPAETADVFGSQSAAWSVGTGCEGSVSYTGDDITFFIHWVNPFFGSNAAYAFITGPKAVLYRATYTAGNGNEAANIRFSISPHPGYFYISSVASGLVLDVPGFSTDNAHIQQYPANGGDNQLWQLIPHDELYFTIKNKFSKKILDVQNGRTDNGEWIIQGPDHADTDGDNQLWQFDFTNPNDGIMITNKKSQKVLDVPYGANDVRLIQQFDRNGGAPQRWRLSPVL